MNDISRFVNKSITVSQTEQIEFTEDMGASFWNNILTVGRYWMIFFAVVILLGELKMKVEFSLFATIIEFVVALLIASILSITGAYFDVSQIRFEKNGLFLRSPMFVQYGYGKNKFISYPECKVRERGYWRVTRINYLIIYEGKNPSCRIDDQTWRRSYSSIKAELEIRVGERLGPTFSIRESSNL